jgi:predicted RNA binding protein YcfA (HicA-like mRNA interferase family)
MGKAYSSRELMDLIQADGWYLVETEGSHHQFKHPTKPGRVTVKHPQKDVPKGTANSVLKQAGLK